MTRLYIVNQDTQLIPQANTFYLIRSNDLHNTNELYSTKPPIRLNT